MWVKTKTQRVLCEKELPCTTPHPNRRCPYFKRLPLKWLQSTVNPWFSETMVTDWTKYKVAPNVYFHKNTSSVTIKTFHYHPALCVKHLLTMAALSTVQRPSVTLAAQTEINGCYFVFSHVIQTLPSFVDKVHALLAMFKIRMTKSSSWVFFSVHFTSNIN